MYDKSDILHSADQLAAQLRQVDEIATFRRAEEQIHKSTSVMEKIERLKQLQQQAVNFEQYDKKKALMIVEQEIAQLEREIDSLPIVVQYTQVQEEANELLQLVTKEIRASVRDTLRRRTE